MVKSHAYAVGRVRVLEQTLIGRATLERLVSAATIEELARTLGELGWGEAKNASEVLALAANHVKDACALVRSDSPEPQITDCFLLKFDILNLKLLLKSRVLGQPADFLSPCGTIPVERLARCVEENRYADLPKPLCEVMERIERHIAVKMDPLYVDAELDKTMAEMIHEAVCNGDPVIRQYFAARSDLTNLLIALRSAAMGRGSAFAQELFLPGGEVSFEALARVADDPERAYAAIEKRPYAPLFKEALSPDSPANMAAVERILDDYLLNLIRPYKYQPTSVLPLIGYLLAREREAAAVRMIVTAKSAHISAEKLTERLRALYA